MPNTATRLITLIMLLQRQPNQKAADLARELGVSVRSLHRYIAMLDEMGIPIYSERGPQGGFSLVRGYKMPPLVFSPEEAVAVSLGTGLVGELWGQLYEEAARSALAKLENVLPDDQQDEIAWARRALVTTGLYRPGLGEYAPVLQTLRGALHQQKRLRLVYQSASRPEAGTREVDPYALAHSRGWWYLVGFCHLRQAVRAFRVDRIREVTVLEAGFETPPGFDARQHLNLEAAGAPVRARLRFAPEAAHLALNNRPAWEAVETRPDGGVIATLSMPDLLWAASLALSYGPAVTVEEPEALRHLVADWARAVAAQYPPESHP